MSIKGIYQLSNEDIEGIYKDALFGSFRSWTDELQSGNALSDEEVDSIIN